MSVSLIRHPPLAYRSSTGTPLFLWSVGFRRQEQSEAAAAKGTRVNTAASTLGFLANHSFKRLHRIN